MNKIKLLATTALIAMGSMFFTACNDSQSYADLLQDERKACNAYLANFKIVNSIPKDTIFEIGPNAPYYRIEEEGNIYMQVLDAGDPDDKVSYDDLIYFRFMRLSILDWYESDGTYDTWTGNAFNMASSPTSFRYGNYALSSTSQYGAGIQVPLQFLGVGCHVNILIKSQYGFTDEIAYVTPFVYDIRYFRPQT